MCGRHLHIKVSLPISSMLSEGSGCYPSQTQKTLTSSVMADAGCQSFLAGIQVNEHLGLTGAELIPVTMKMNAANDKGINILGAAILGFTGIGKPVSRARSSPVPGVVAYGK